MHIRNINKVAIVGGVHGNELTGIHLIKEIQTNSQWVVRPTFQTLYFLGNPSAIAAGKRYIETDLNRCFSAEDLNNPALTNYEQLRAKEIATLITAEKVDFIVDVHSTTSEMGMTIILNSEHLFLQQLAAYLSYHYPSIKFLRYNSTQPFPYLRSLCPLGLTIEVGSILHNEFNQKLFEETKVVLEHILDYINAFNQKISIPMVSSLDLYEQVKVLDYPRDSQGQVMGKISPYLENYQLIDGNKPIFTDLSDNNIYLDLDTTYYPVFLAEESYKEKGIAMGLSILKTVTGFRC
ncbi:MAG: aspartoacylase [Microcystaceae cyanobacterium]